MSLLSLALSTLALLVAPARAEHILPQIEAAPQIVWAGIDYSRVRIFVPETFDDPNELIYMNPTASLPEITQRFKNPKEVWNELIVDWNSMAVNEQVKRLEKTFQREITVDLPGPAGQTVRKGDTYFESVYDAKNAPVELTEATIQSMVKQYRMTQHKGVAFAVIMDRLSKPEKEACGWPTWFELEKKTVLSTKRVCRAPGGGGFRNYWFDLVPHLFDDVASGVKSRDL